MNLPWKLIIYKKVEMTIMSYFQLGFWTERRNIFVGEVCFDHHDLIHNTRMTHKILKILCKNSRKQQHANHYGPEGVIKLPCPPRQVQWFSRTPGSRYVN